MNSAFTCFLEYLGAQDHCLRDLPLSKLYESIQSWIEGPARTLHPLWNLLMRFERCQLPGTPVIVPSGGKPNRYLLFLLGPKEKKFSAQSNRYFFSTIDTLSSKSSREIISPSAVE